MKIRLSYSNQSASFLPLLVLSKIVYMCTGHCKSCRCCVHMNRAEWLTALGICQGLLLDQSGIFCFTFFVLFQDKSAVAVAATVSNRQMHVTMYENFVVSKYWNYSGVYCMCWSYLTLELPLHHFFPLVLSKLIFIIFLLLFIPFFRKGIFSQT